MATEGRNKELDRHILGIKSLISSPVLKDLSELTGNIGVGLIDEHTRNGKFYGGEYANRPYSTVDLPVFFFGNFEVVEKTGNIRVNGREGPSNVLLKLDKDFYWRKAKSTGKATAYLKNGYAGWLKKTRPGKNLQEPDLTYSGAMLRNLTYSVTVTSERSQIEFYVRPPEDLKAYYTHIKRNWLGFFEKEINKIIERASQFIGEDAVKRLHGK